MNKYFLAVYKRLKDFRTSFIIIDEEKKNPGLGTVILSCIMGGLLIIYILWIRLIREGLPREIVGEPFTLQFWIVLLLFIICLSTTITHLIHLRRLLPNNQSNNSPKIDKFINYISEIPIVQKIVVSGDYIVTYILGGPLLLWRTLIANIPEKVTRHFTQVIIVGYPSRLDDDFFTDDTKKRKFRLAMTTIVFLFLPRIIASMAYFYDVAINRELNFFYQIVVILLISLIFLALRQLCLILMFLYQGLYHMTGLR